VRAAPSRKAKTEHHVISRVCGPIRICLGVVTAGLKSPHIGSYPYYQAFVDPHLSLVQDTMLPLECVQPWRIYQNVTHRRIVLFLFCSSVIALTVVNLHYAFSVRQVDQWQQHLQDLRDDIHLILNSRSFQGTTSVVDANNTRVKIAYAVTVTSYNPASTKGQFLFDRAAVLHQSIKLAMNQSHRYDYDMYAFVHPDARWCGPSLTRLGYNVQIRDTPFNISEIQNTQLIEAQKNGCCGEKEYLKLYSYLLFDYPIVVHLDLDTIVLKPMDDVFDLMVGDPSYNMSVFNSSTMWTNMESYYGMVDFVFTRDYNMVRIE
jgi:alpha-N-acetylglucosamine transferase